MITPGARKKPGRRIDVDAVAARIAEAQRPDGEIPWCDGLKTDPWDHVEAAMGLAVGGRLVEARRAFEWLKNRQNADGSWYAAYRNGIPEDRTLDANMTSYVAVGLYHYHLATGDRVLLEEMWDVMRRAIDFAVGLQTPEGPVNWAVSPEGRVDPMSLLTGSSSIFMSLKCALAVASILGRPATGWKASALRLAAAIRHKRHLFNMTKSRFSMDWFYPVLSGALTGTDARKRLEKYWRKFVIEGQGVRCVFDEPWVTVAETCELVLALAAMGSEDAAHLVFGWISDKRYDDGSFWCGYTFPEMVIWPEDRLAWTNAAVLMAADRLYRLTPAGRLFNHGFWAQSGLI
ncbi:MAG: phenyltransferase domain-containing protein [Desulfobacterales bacterium]